MKIPRSKLKQSHASFHGVIPETSATPLGTIKLPVTFGSRENFRTEDISFEVTDFEAAYHAILGRPALTKFMAVPHYTYMLMKLPGPNGIISLQGDVRRSFDCDQESCTLAENIQERPTGTPSGPPPPPFRTRENFQQRKQPRLGSVPTKMSRR